MYGEQIAENVIPEPRVEVESLVLSGYATDFVAGLAGGCAGLAFGHPFDTIKVRQQLASGDKVSILRCAKQTIANDGFRGFFKGMSFPLAAVGFLNSIFFGVYGNSIRFICCSEDADIKPSYQAIFIAGGFAGAIQGIPACPIDLVKVRLQAQTGKGGVSRYKGPFDCITSIYRKHGMRGCFRGITPTILREIPGFSVYITSYEYMCDQFTAEGEDFCSTPSMLLAGGLAGMFSWMVNIPVDIIKSRMQNDSLSNPKYKSTWDCARQLMRQDGWRVFWRGLPVICIRAFPTNGVTFVVYSKSLQYFQGKKKSSSNDD